MCLRLPLYQNRYVLRGMCLVCYQNHNVLRGPRLVRYRITMCYVVCAGSAFLIAIFYVVREWPAGRPRNSTNFS